ncbi:hypothetical protein SAMN05444339_10241 [Loktanella atrilutea]|uniref:Uncharacterized protein n=1 Tax=Loktanella atrilutea TaxID=366533 RepID=A0A1M4W9X1_LOKAT|nr:hypothetical protein [Loktanella atrilutea]SHE78009.1 hypothetical protein SAMN05444339_10241 [Loktanella atrilutea]
MRNQSTNGMQQMWASALFLIVRDIVEPPKCHADPVIDQNRRNVWASRFAYFRSKDFREVALCAGIDGEAAAQRLMRLAGDEAAAREFVRLLMMPAKPEKEHEDA